MLKIYTSRISYRGEDALDITVKSATTQAGRLLAPTAAMVFGHKAWKGDTRFQRFTPVTGEQYSETYLKLLRQRYAKAKQVFMDLLEKESLTLCCYCRYGTFCHRHLAANVLVKIATAHEIACVLAGER